MQKLGFLLTHSAPVPRDQMTTTMHLFAEKKNHDGSLTVRQTLEMQKHWNAIFTSKNLELVC